MKITNEHTFNNCGIFEVEYQGKTYNAKWEERGKIKRLDMNAPIEVYNIVYKYLFNEVYNMKKKDLINACIDKSYNVSKEEVKKAIKDVTNREYMKIDFSVKQWKALYEKLINASKGREGNIHLFYGSNVEFYRQK